MAEIKWIKIVTDIFDDEKILLIESLPSADSIIVIWFKLLCLAGKNNNDGVFMLNDKIAYTDEMLATIFRRDVNTVRLALSTFEQYGMVEIINNVITIPNWDKHQTLDAYEKKKERDRVYQQKRREKQKLLVQGKESSDNQTTPSSDVAVSDKEEDKERDIDIEEDIYSISKDILVPKNLVPIVEKWNSLNLSKINSIKGNRLKLLNARIKEYGKDEVLNAIEMISKSSFLKGQNNRNWTITFDWLVKPNNFPKVLEGNYTDKEVDNESRGVSGTTKDNGQGSKWGIKIDTRYNELSDEDRRRIEEELD